MRLCVGWRKLNGLLVLDRGGFGDIASVFDGLPSKRHFTQVDLASGYTHVTIAKKDRHEAAFRDAKGPFFESIRAGFGLTTLPATFTRIVRRALGNPYPDVVSWLDDILIPSNTWKGHITTLGDVSTKVSNARLSVNYSNGRFAGSSRQFLGVKVDATGMKPAPSKFEVIANIPELTTEGDNSVRFQCLSDTSAASCRGIA